MIDPEVYEGGFSDPALQSSKAFRIAMKAMANPGQIYALSGAEAPAPLSKAAATLLLTLCDPETRISVHGPMDQDDIRQWLTFHTNAPFVSAQEADFAIGTWETLRPIERFAIGTPEYPDRSCTLIIQREELRNQGTSLSGPGIADSMEFDLPDPSTFVENHRRFPLGLDCFFVADEKVAAVPRSTRIELSNMAESV